MAVQMPFMESKNEMVLRLNHMEYLNFLTASQTYYSNNHLFLPMDISLTLKS